MYDHIDIRLPGRVQWRATSFPKVVMDVIDIGRLEVFASPSVTYGEDDNTPTPLW